MDLEIANPMKIHLVPRLGKGRGNADAAAQEPEAGAEAGAGPGLEPIVLPLTPGFTIHSVAAFERDEEGEGEGVAGASRRVVELYTTAWLSKDVAEGRVAGGLLGSWEGAAPHFDDIPLTLLYKTVVDVGAPGSAPRVVFHGPVPGQVRGGQCLPLLPFRDG